MHLNRPISIYNNGSATIPPYGCVEITDITEPETGSLVYKVVAPTTGGSQRHLIFNSAFQIKVAEYGISQDGPPYIARWTASSSGYRPSVANGRYTEWGPNGGGANPFDLYDKAGGFYSVEHELTGSSGNSGLCLVHEHGKLNPICVTIAADVELAYSVAQAGFAIAFTQPVEQNPTDTTRMLAGSWTIASGVTATFTGLVWVSFHIQLSPTYGKGEDDEWRAILQHQRTGGSWVEVAQVVCYMKVAGDEGRTLDLAPRLLKMYAADSLRILLYNTQGESSGVDTFNLMEETFLSVQPAY